MSTAPTPATTQLTQSWLDVLTRQRKQTAYVLFGVAVAFGVASAWWIYKNKWDFWPVSAWGLALTLIAAAGGFWQMLRDATNESDVTTTRLFVLTIGGLTGLATTLLGLFLPLFQWLSIITGGLESWRTNLWRIGVCLAAIKALSKRVEELEAQLMAKGHGEAA